MSSLTPELKDKEKSAKLTAQQREEQLKKEQAQKAADAEMEAKRKAIHAGKSGTSNNSESTDEDTSTLSHAKQDTAKAKENAKKVFKKAKDLGLKDPKLSDDGTTVTAGSGKDKISFDLEAGVINIEGKLTKKKLAQAAAMAKAAGVEEINISSLSKEDQIKAYKAFKAQGIKIGKHSLSPQELSKAELSDGGPAKEEPGSNKKKAPEPTPAEITHDKPENEEQARLQAEQFYKAALANEKFTGAEFDKENSVVTLNHPDGKVTYNASQGQIVIEGPPTAEKCADVAKLMKDSGMTGQHDLTQLPLEQQAMWHKALSDQGLDTITTLPPEQLNNSQTATFNPAPKPTANLSESQQQQLAGNNSSASVAPPGNGLGQCLHQSKVDNVAAEQQQKTDHNMQQDISTPAPGMGMA